MKKFTLCTLSGALSLALIFSGCMGETTSPPPKSSYESSDIPSAESKSSQENQEYAYSTDMTATEALSPNFSDFNSISVKEYNWGHGGPVDEFNRSCGALQYNKKFKAYNCAFIGQKEDKIYLTFDEGYENGYTASMLDTLKKHNAKGCFFLTYDYAVKNDELIRRMIDEGHILGNHSTTHRNFGKLSAKEVYEDTAKLHNYIKDKYGYEMKYFRFPSGNFSEQSMAVVNSLGYKAVFWSFAHKDWVVDEQPEESAALAKLKKGICPGSIYLLHCVSRTNAHILDDLLTAMENEGYKFASLDNLNIKEE